MVKSLGSVLRMSFRLVFWNKGLKITRMVQKILITRPLPAAKVLAREIKEVGFESVIEPMLKIENTEVNLPDLSSFDGFIFTSANGVHAYTSISDTRDKPVFTVGQKTADEARRAGFFVVESAGKDVLALAQFMRSQKGLYAHFRGQDVSSSLIETLSSEEALFINEFVIYRAVKTQNISPKILKYIENNEISHALFYSKRTAEAFVALLRNHECTSFVKRIKALCLADSMVKCLSVLPWADIQIAAHPDQQSMLELLKKSD